MRRRYIIGASVALAVLGAVIVFCPSQPNQPNYQGQPIAYWIHALGISSSQSRTQAVTALLQIGTNGLPFILSEIQTPDRKAADSLMRLLARVRLSRSHYTPPSVRRQWALQAFAVLGPTIGKPTLLDLLAHPSRRVGDAASGALAQFPIPEGQEALLAALSSTNSRVRAAAATGLHSGGFFPHAALTPLAQCLRDTNPDVRLRAAESLVWYCQMYWGRSIPMPVVTNLVQSLTDSDATVRRFAAEALGRAKVRSELVTSGLAVAVTDRDTTVRNSAQSALRAISPEAAAPVTQPR